MYELITLVIEKVSTAHFGPGFCILGFILIVILIVSA